jgi:membrane protein required for colicin V production
MAVADLAIIGVMVLSGVLALMRGFTREVASIISWAGAAFTTLWLFPPLLPTGRSLLSFVPTLARDVTTGVLIFMVALIAFSYLTTKVTEKVRGKEPGPWDGTAGFLFGLGRGFIIVCLLFLFYGWVVQPKNDPAWIQKSKFLPLIKKTDNAFEVFALKAQDRIPVNTSTRASRDDPGGSRGSHRVWFPTKKKDK